MKLKDSSFIPKPSLSFDFEFDINDDSQLLFVFGKILYKNRRHGDAPKFEIYTHSTIYTYFKSIEGN